MTVDIIGREIAVDDFVVYYSHIYKVLGVTNNYIRVIIEPKSKTSRSTAVPANLVALLPKEDVLLWLLSRINE